MMRICGSVYNSMFSSWNLTHPRFSLRSERLCIVAKFVASRTPPFAQEDIIFRYKIFLVNQRFRVWSQGQNWEAKSRVNKYNPVLLRKKFKMVLI